MEGPQEYKREEIETEYREGTVVLDGINESPLWFVLLIMSGTLS